MRTTTIITAKIERSIFTLIDQGTKQFEVRNESFQDSNYIQYIDTATGCELGIYQLSRTYSLIQTARIPARDFALAASGVDRKTFDRLFPPQTSYAYHIAAIGERTTLNAIFNSAQNEQPTIPNVPTWAGMSFTNLLQNMQHKAWEQGARTGLANTKPTQIQSFLDHNNPYKEHTK